MPGESKEIARPQTRSSVEDQPLEDRRFDARRYRAFFEQSRDGLYFSTADGHILDANRAFLDLFQLRRENLEEVSVTSLYAEPQDRARFQDAIRERGSVVDYEVRLRRADGEVFDALLTASATTAGGEICGYHGILRDITRRKAVESALRESEERYRRLVETSPETILVHCEGAVVYVNPAGVELLAAREPEDLLGRPVMSLIHPDYREIAAERILAVERGSEQPSLEEKLLRLDGSEVEVEVCAIPFSHQGKAACQTVVRDISERRRVEARLMEAALYDRLTGLPNRALFLDRLAMTMKRARRHQGQTFAVLCLDLDGFKLINDSLGHTSGDRLLVEVARRLEAQARPGDTVAYLGGDEFGFLLNHLRSLHDAVELAQKAAEALAEPFRLDGQEVFTTACMGIARCEPETARPSELLRDADIAVLRAKRQGRASHAVFEARMRTHAQAQLRLENDLRRAVEREELEVHYQPIVSLEGGRITGFEALVRWRHPQRGLLAPDDFLPQAEETGLIVPLGEWVLRAACRQANAWHRRFPDREPLGVTVNLFSRELTRPDLVERTLAILRETGLEPRCLRLEMTESVLIDDPELAVEVLEALEEEGVRVCLDDFGTGYSSLSYLQRLPLDILKIDRTFVRELLGSGNPDSGNPDSGVVKLGGVASKRPRQQGSAIIEAVLGLAHSLCLEVVAEGVETAPQLERLRELGCDLGQGFYFAPPLDAGSASALIARDPSW